MMHNVGIRTFTFLSFLSISLLVTNAISSTLQELENAELQVKAKHYEEAIGQTQPLLDKFLLNTVEEIILAHRILGVAHCELGDHPKAREHFDILLTFSPTESIKGFVRTNPCRSLFSRAKQEKSPKRTAAKKQTEPEIESEQTQPLVTTPKPEPPATAEPLSPGLWKRYMPFGTGQFANHETGKGWIFLTTEVAAVASGTTFYFLFRNERNPDGSFANPSRADIYRGLVWGSIGVGALAATWGIIDAVVVYKKRIKNTQARFEFDGSLLTYHF